MPVLNFTTQLNDKLAGTYDVEYWPDSRVFMLHDIDLDQHFMVSLEEMRPLLERYYTEAVTKSLVVLLTSGRKLRLIPTQMVAVQKVAQPIDPHAEFMKEQFTAAAVERALEAVQDAGRRTSDDEQLGTIIR